ncbi:shikimate dehydrogenase [Ruminococcus sp.]|uniref:shikimate dehydrogenase family protein n=1 Tax=Ruminococcus sp. TaxID=41978 RepID=UPI002610D099|nr:shikimate dehydrogenase [Ruminococcus sp.]MDD6990011.1 shikimate dehydrogenase [Ruminococcus sp.]MDY6202268.1 shikimate dehydrogenase [Ruminococcus sp.]
MSIKKFAVIGHPIGHTMSPFIHNRLFELSGIEAEYTKLDIAPENLADEYSKVLAKLDGYNITIPHKQNIIPLIDEIDEKAKMYGSVNTVANFDGVAKGYTTDPDGFLKALNAAGITLDGRVVILGCGGVARTMAYEVVLKGLPLLFAVRKEDVDIAKLLCNEIENTVKGAKVSFCLIDELSGDIDVLVNATPLGMFPKIDVQPVSDSVINRCASVFDAVYNPLETVLIKKALANGAKAVGGMSMLVWQAVVAHEKWDGSVYDKDDIAKLCIDSAEELKNR